MKRLASILVAAAATACATTTEAPRVTAADLSGIVGEGWAGSLTYRDYSPPYGEVVIPAGLRVSETAQGLVLAYTYPKEPHANSESPFLISAGGTVLDGGRVTSIDRTPGSVRITTEEACEDAGQPAVCLYDYRFAGREIRIGKRVQPGSGAEAFQRNVYTFVRP